MNRISSIMDNLIGLEDPDDLMLELMETLKDDVSPVPDVGELYIFVYNPKTPNIQYDQNPLVAVTDIFSWGFRGYNFHWNKSRNYTWNEVAGQLYSVHSNELSDLRELPFAKFLINN